MLVLLPLALHLDHLLGVVLSVPSVQELHLLREGMPCPACAVIAASGPPAGCSTASATCAGVALARGGGPPFGTHCPAGAAACTAGCGTAGAICAGAAGAAGCAGGFVSTACIPCSVGSLSACIGCGVANATCARTAPASSAGGSPACASTAAACTACGPPDGCGAASAICAEVDGGSPCAVTAATCTASVPLVRHAAAAGVMAAGVSGGVGTAGVGVPDGCGTAAACTWTQGATAPVGIGVPGEPSALVVKANTDGVVGDAVDVAGDVTARVGGVNDAVVPSAVGGACRRKERNHMQ